MSKMDKQLEKLETNVIYMGQQVIVQHQFCVDILQDFNDQAAEEIIDGDKIINDYEADINDQAMACFALLSPVAKDLRRIVVAIKIASELERIGDYAKSLALFIKRNEQEYKSLLGHAVIMEQHVVHMLKSALEAYKNEDIKKAYEIPKQDAYLDELLNEFKYKIAESSTIDLKQVFYLSGVFRNIERAGDHIVNICEHIVYLVKAVQYDFDS